MEQIDISFTINMEDIEHILGYTPDYVDFETLGGRFEDLFHEEYFYDILRGVWDKELLLKPAFR